jgi:4-methyl-5(b-hydroxyethyl)-thiazole monophosphate biosynthesis
MDNKKTAVVFMADGMEMCECLLTVDILRRAGVNVITASVMGHKKILTSHQVMVYADQIAEDVDFSSADLVVLPGGRVGTENLGKCSIVTEQCKAFAAESGKYVAAICAAPSVLSAIGLLDGKSATCHPDFEGKITSLAKLTRESVTVDGNIITGQALGATTEFALCLAEILAGREKAEGIAKAICWKH